MLIEILISISLMVIAASHGYQAYLLCLQQKKLRLEERKQPEVKKEWKFEEAMVPSHVVKKKELEEEPDKYVESLADIAVDQMSYDDKRALNAALAEDDNQNF